MNTQLLPYTLLVPELVPDDVPASIREHYPLPAWMFIDNEYDTLRHVPIGATINNGTYGIRLGKQGRTVHDKPYVRIHVYDRGDQLPRVLWVTNDSDIEQFSEIVTQSGVARIDGHIQEYPKGSLQRQVIVRRFSKSNVQTSALLPTAWPSYDVYSHLYQLIKIVSQLRTPLNKIGLAGLKMSWPTFGMVPAALRHHHAKRFYRSRTQCNSTTSPIH